MRRSGEGDKQNAGNPSVATEDTFKRPATISESWGSFFRQCPTRESLSLESPPRGLRLAPVARGPDRGRLAVVRVLRDRQ